LYNKYYLLQLFTINPEGKRFIFNIKIEEVFFDIKLTQQKEKYQSLDVEKNREEFEEYWQQYDTYSDDNTCYY
ncbi:31705_t:CDS:2, partial [Racocetra persica]